MTTDEALDLLDTLLHEHSLRDLQEQVFRYSWEGRTYPQIAQQVGYDTGYIRDIGYELWRLLTQTLGERVTKNNVHVVLRRQLNRKAGLVDPSAQEVAESQNGQHQYWGERIDVSAFWGRETELRLLEQWLAGNSEGEQIHPRCRLVSLVGMGGMGKTALAAKLTEQLQGEFDTLFWQSLRNAPPLDKVLSHLIAILSQQQQTTPLGTLDAQISQLMEYLRTSRCLLIFDNFESILSANPLENSSNSLSSAQAGGYREGYEGYDEILRRIGTERHTSCLLLTSREKPQTLIPLEGESSSVRTMNLQDLGEIEVQEICTAHGCYATAQSDWHQVKQHYSGNPLAIKIAATTIRDLFDGSIATFLEQGVILFDGISTLLAQQFDRLSPLEKQVMYWLAIDREAVSIAQLLADFMPSGLRSQLLGALQSLGRRSLIEKSAGHFTLQPVVMEYVTEVLIEKVCEEIATLNLEIFVSHALIQAQAKDYVRESQIRMILAPLAERLRVKFRSQQDIKNHLDRLLSKLRAEFSGARSYGGGNVINLLHQLKIDLSGYDFSSLCLWQAYLQGINVHNTNFADANLEKSVFTETFSSIHSVAFSPDGQRLASGDFNGDICLWDASTHQLQSILKGHANWVQSVTYSPNSKILASGSFDCTVRLWDIDTGACLKTLTGHTLGVYSVAFSPEGKVLASGSDDYTIRLWDVNTGECLTSLQYEDDINPHGFRSVAFSPDGQTLASSSSEPIIRLWHIQTRRCFQTLGGHQGWVWSVAFSPDGKVLASGGDDATVKIWDVSTGECLRTLLGHSDELRSVVFSEDGQILISGSKDRTIKLWDIQAGQCLKTLVGHENWIWAVAFNPTHQIIASGGEDRTIRLWSLGTGQCLRVFQGYTNTIYSVAFVPSPNLAAPPDPNTANTPDLLASGYFDQVVRLWNIRDGQYISFRGHTDAIRAVAVSPDGQLLAGGASSADPTIKLWSVRDGQCCRNLSGHTNEIWSVSFSPDGQMLASGSTDHTIRLWITLTGQCLKILEGHRHWVMSVAFCSEKDILASAGFDQTIKFWNVQTGVCIRTWQGEQLAICSIALSPSGDILASASIDSTIALWDMATGECFQVLLGHTHFVWSVAFSADGQLLASGSFDHTIRIWDVRTGQCLKVLQGHTNGVFSVAFVPQHGTDLADHQVLASAGADATIRLWDVETGECVKIFRSPRPYEGMNILGAKGLTDAQKENLKALGALELTDNHLPID
jgi:WD40 repeat protein/SpoVK/Ycf46/Vps4 family AAA+-type ATPase